MAMDERTPITDPLSKRWVGVVFTNPVTGERIEVLEVHPDGPQSRLEGRLTVAPGGIGPPRHVHPGQQESFTVEKGRLTLHRGDETLEVAPGESVTVPAGTAHGFENRSEQPVTFTGAIRPAGQLTHVLSTLFGLARDGKTRDDGTPHFLQAMVFAQAMQDVLYLADPPRAVQKALWTVFGPIGRALGYRATYDRYLRPDFWARHLQDDPIR